MYICIYIYIRLSQKKSHLRNLYEIPSKFVLPYKIILCAKIG